MKLYQASITTLFPLIFTFWSSIVASVKGSKNPAPYYTSDVAINCGYFGNSTAHDGRQWFGDTGSRSIVSILQPRGKSTCSTADHSSLSADPIPYMTARVSATQFYYIFQVNPGQKFIRLHFYPSSYRGFEKSQDFFTVEAGPFTLLRNFSASLVADALGVRYLVKEFCVNVGEDEYLNLTFSPSRGTKNRNLYAFVNGIEIISMPTYLYYTPDGDLGAPIVGQNARYIVDNSSALEMVHRLNIGGSYISPIEDFGMFRRWTEDANYLLESNLQPMNHLMHQVKYGEGVPVFTFPLKIYYTSWKTGRKYKRTDEMHKFTWKIPVDLGFGYLVRLHFCDFSPKVTEDDSGEFNILMNNQTAETKANVIRLSSGIGVPVYRDYVVIMKGDKKEGKYDLIISLQSSDELVVGFLHGLEIFKLSSFDNNLASSNPMSPSQVSTSRNLKIQNFLLVFGTMNAGVKGMAMLIILNIVVFKLRQIWEDTCLEDKDNQPASTKHSCRHFSLSEIKSATQNFSDEFFIGKGGFGDVYKGFIYGGSKIVAVKRLKSNSKQGAQEFWTEIETLSKIRHIHLVSLIGYCNEYKEMILVYEYMPRGTLADNLYKIGKNGKDGTPLTWEQRLRICIGAAHGLGYLHTGNEPRVVHRDVKDSNILLDENLKAKISDFGLSKLEKITESQCYISTKVKGTLGYLDPDYLITQKLTVKSDIYSFGVVLLVVLCGKPALDRSIPGETRTLVSSFREVHEKGGIEVMIDPNLRGTISSESLSEFLTCVESCLRNEQKKRPTMAQVVARLECSLERQQFIPYSVPDEAVPVDQPSEVENVQPSQFDQYIAPPIVEETMTVIPAEREIRSEEIDTAEVKTKEVFNSREKYHTSVQKSLWVWPWQALRNRGKPKKKNNLVSARKMESESNNSDRFLEPKTMQLTYSKILEITNNFRTVIGKGGFGTIYYGIHAGNQVAVKVRSLSSNQGCSAFQTEVDFLTRVHHRNLITLVGYCYEGNTMALVFEYMANGNLRELLSDNSMCVLSWSERLQIALDVAQGLDYLHNGCKPTIIHRDIKSTNILLNEKLEAKLADFGLSRAFSTEDSSFVSTVIVGTMGYLDPEYYTSSRLRKESDIYCLGIVILELITGRSALFDWNHEKCHITLWVNLLFVKEDLETIVDPKLNGDYDMNSTRKALNVAMACSSSSTSRRPAMPHVIKKLSECLAAERARIEGLSINSSDVLGLVTTEILNSDPGPRGYNDKMLQKSRHEKRHVVQEELRNIVHSEERDLGEPHETAQLVQDRPKKTSVSKDKHEHEWEDMKKYISWSTKNGCRGRHQSTQIPTPISCTAKSSSECKFDVEPQPPGCAMSASDLKLIQRDIPSFMIPYIVDVVDVVGDGNCGYRAVAHHVYGDEHYWPIVRMDIVRDMDARPDLYNCMFENSEALQRLKDSIKHFEGPAPEDKWMDLLDLGFVIATTYNLVCVSFSHKGSITFVPLINSGNDHTSRDYKIIHIGCLESRKHFVALSMVDDAPVPLIHRGWYYWRDPLAKKWETILSYGIANWERLL